MVPNAAVSFIDQFVTTLDPIAATWVHREHYVYGDRDLACIVLATSGGEARRLTVEAVQNEAGGLPVHTYWTEWLDRRRADWQYDDEIEFGESTDPTEVLADAVGWFAVACHDLFEHRSPAEFSDD